MPSRYDGKPFLRLLECYVLWAIEKLGEKEEAALEKITVKLQKIYSNEGEWHEIIAREMDFSNDTKDMIIQVWQKNQLIAQRLGEDLSPDDFAQMFVDKNFNSLKH